MAESAILERSGIADEVGDSDEDLLAPDASDAFPAPGPADARSVDAVAPPAGLLLRVQTGSPAWRRGQMYRQSVDPEVSKHKFQRELAAFRRHEAAYRSRGWIFTGGEFPQATFLLVVSQVRPIALLFGVVVDFTNYDIEPPSVRVFEPLTGRLLRINELSTRLPRRVAPTSQSERLGAVPAADGETFPVVDLLQALGNDGIPFLCIPGVREYHEHPGHTGDSWLLHRGTGAGTLDSILNAFHTYGVAPVRGYGIASKKADNEVELVMSNAAVLVIQDVPT